jgi:UDP-N-acetylglucosamine diphosphorylase/glucosamine-1-phosphate N-acetyltransferase
MHAVIFEGSRWGSFAPMSLTRPVFMLPCGLGTLLDKQLRSVNPSRLTLWVRPEMAEYCKKLVVPRLKIPTAVNVPLDDEPAALVSGRSLHFSRYESAEQESVVVDEGDVVRKAYVKSPGLGPEDAFKRSSKWLKLLDLPHAMPQGRLAEWVWDLINWNEEAIVADALLMDGGGKLPAGPYHVVGNDDVYVAPEVKLGPNCVLDASRGPVVLAKGVKIGAGSVLEGPCFVGEYTTVAPLTSILAGTTIGPQCKIGGSIFNSVIIGFANKAYEGYLGDSYVGEWTNLGAGTTTANVKTTYGEISVQIGGHEIKTGRRSMGTVIGDHTKTSIGTRLTPGCYIGCCCMLAAAGLTPRFVPSFSFRSDKGTERVDIEKFVEVARSVFDRRDKQLAPLDEQIIRDAAEAAPGVEK